MHLKLKKCKFTSSEVEYLGVIIHPDELAMDQVKLDSVCSWPTHRSPRMFIPSWALPISIDNLFPTSPMSPASSLTLPRNTVPGPRLLIVRLPLITSRSFSYSSQSSTYSTSPTPSPLPLTPPNMPPEVFFSRPTPTGTATPVPTSPSNSLQQNGIMTSMTENCSLLVFKSPVADH